jgi:signal transduction histidine kinase
MSEIIANVVEVFEPTAEDEGVSLSSTLPNNPLVVSGDRDLLTQLLSNLVENAIRHCPSGKCVEVSGHKTPDGTVLRVADTGPGILEVDRERIFRRFFRGEVSRNGFGNGLGLALVKAISEMHEAAIHVLDNHPGVVFEIRFPACRQN